ncbi:alpha/beta fold hydrolase [Gordonia sp. (in: high G+C Gram-positive bacteria)]|uniref:alpha/beta fold hydrolase n=1 Tax=Gordonia sp. (in: high G+C Gram-positive bacteria) TaxID=84139 RepID=UPI003C759BEC
MTGKNVANSKWATARRWGLYSAIGLAGATAAQFAITGSAMLREVLKYPKPIDDGPDPLLEQPTHAMRSSVVGTPDGALLHVVASGDVNDSDEILVLIHGWTCNTSFWNPQFNHFGSSRPVIAYDQRGHGLSELGPNRPTVDMLGQDLQAVLEAMIPEGKRAVLVGHSMGGMTIMSWAQQFGAGMEEKISGIVLVSTAGLGVIQRQELIPDSLPALARPGKAVLTKFFTSAPLPLPSNSTTSLFSHYVTLGPVVRKAYVDFTDEIVAACSAKARAAWGAAMYPLDVLSGLDRITVPTSVVVGSADLLTPVKHAQEMATILSSRGFLHSYTSYEGAGHMVPIERADAFNALIDELLADVSVAAG